MTKAAVEKPAYLHIPTPAPNGHDPASQPVVEVAGAGPAESTRPEPSVKDPTDAVVEAAGAVFRALATRLAYHERQAQRVREAMAPFAAAVRQNATPAVPTVGDESIFAQVLSIARNLPGAGEGNLS